MRHNIRVIFVSLVKMGFHHVGQAGLELLTLSNLSASASQGISHRAWPGVFRLNGRFGVSEQVNERVLNRLHQVQRITRRLQQERRFLMRVLDSYGDDYRASQFTIVLEDEGSQGTDAPTPGNAENEPPEKEALSPPRRTPAPPEPGSPAPGEGPSGRKRRRVPRDGRRAGTALTPELASVQIKVEEDFGFEADEALDSSWVSRGPDKLLPYPTLASPASD
ncbi:TCF3 fusion partner isoform X2 [Macaca nemestrina]|uniref:TCF3 fusion partner isoform X2 n=1 Tax=Macaca nemestrina TaxID=9545 RepID=UPI0039B959E8